VNEHQYTCNAVNVQYFVVVSGATDTLHVAVSTCGVS
jgi:hypothetical protein